MSDQDTPRSEAEALPADPLFNPGHPDHAGWAGQPTPTSPPAEPAPSNAEQPSTSGDPDSEKAAQQPDAAASTATSTRKR